MELRDIWNLRFGATWEPRKVRMINSPKVVEYTAIPKRHDSGIHYLFPNNRDMEGLENNDGSIGRLIGYVADNDDIDWLAIKNADHKRVFVYLKPTPNLSQEDFDEMFRHSVVNESEYDDAKTYPLRLKNDEERPSAHKLDISHADDCQCIQGNTSPCSNWAMSLMSSFDEQVNKIGATWEPHKVKKVIFEPSPYEWRECCIGNREHGLILPQDIDEAAVQEIRQGQLNTAYFKPWFGKHSDVPWIAVMRGTGVLKRTKAYTASPLALTEEDFAEMLRQTSDAPLNIMSLDEPEDFAFAAQHASDCDCPNSVSRCASNTYQLWQERLKNNPDMYPIKQAATWEPHRVKMPLVTVSGLETCLGDEALQRMLAKTHERAMTKWKEKIGARNEQEVQGYINNKVPYTVTGCLLDDDDSLATYEADSQANLHLRSSELERHNAIKIRGESIHPHIQITFLGHPGASINTQARKMFSNLKDESVENPLDAFDEGDIAGGLVVAYTDTDGHVHTHHAVRDNIEPTKLTDYAFNFLHHFNNAWNTRHHDEWCSQGADCAIQAKEIY